MARCKTCIESVRLSGGPSGKKCSECGEILGNPANKVCEKCSQKKISANTVENQSSRAIPW
ncbi:MAG: hypothetical protein A2599_01170 [Candidatus Staskawiczbacteria bacterium RIFOXYD1_FULL_39_28]|uniref:Uncharacterized protein n=1 Tax=Candidatus Staskawiczbacteria bacterium RIFOXYC1_FULL_38_18 TaxID=1802229 RepID=A0A1G2JEK3_9BACT|nr:MAG: hypothetical protein A2401_02180 [Candidatus Staskawiczbacteria bacterium RIFOXYC1_FULL_38_18]OGZ92376.1 MAG: hypothetical protein A2599_01170 [Candidatus Staskawiczbacteria bacterium RIFOXYD1_FULL_39_28]